MADADAATAMHRWDLMYASILGGKDGNCIVLINENHNVG